MQLFNSLTKQIEEFKPIDSESRKVGVYACGPTVYFYPHIGNWRTFVLGDLLVRTLSFMGYKPNYLMNITDVGHLTGDNLGDASSGDDRLEKAALKEGKTAWDVAKYYTQNFLLSYEKLNLTWPEGHKFCKATEHISEQIEMVKKIEAKGFTYKIEDGIYFDVGEYEKAGNVYGLMSNIHKDSTEARIVENTAKKDGRDFALWKFSPKDQKRQMEWESPWGTGFPGWHIECSAMSTKYLGDQFDIHLGGEDHKSTHHPNEIVQSEVATGKIPFVKYWMHGAFLQVNGGRMGKSLGNAYTLEEIEIKGYNAMALRYFYLTGHYRKQMNFTFEGLDGASKSLSRLKKQVIKLVELRNEQELPIVDIENEYYSQFVEAIGDDLNMPQALAVVWDMIGDVNLNFLVKLSLISKFDQVLGLGLLNIGVEEIFPKDILELASKRDSLRLQKKWDEADQIRLALERQGYAIKDTSNGGLVEIIRK